MHFLLYLNTYLLNYSGLQSGAENEKDSIQLSDHVIICSRFNLIS